MYRSILVCSGGDFFVFLGQLQFHHTENTGIHQKSAADEQKLKQILADKDAQKKMLSTPQAQELLRKLFGK